MIRNAKTPNETHGHANELLLNTVKQQTINNMNWKEPLINTMNH